MLLSSSKHTNSMDSLNSLAIHPYWLSLLIIQYLHRADNYKFLLHCQHWWAQSYGFVFSAQHFYLSYLDGLWDGRYEVHTISFQTFFVWAFKIVVDSWKFTMLLLYILWDDWPIFMISASNEQQELEYTLLKPDCHRWWISKMQSDTLEERYAIKFCFKLGKKMPQKRMKCFRLLLEHLAWNEHQFLSGIRDSR